jgi:hypothetical protein
MDDAQVVTRAILKAELKAELTQIELRFEGRMDTLEQRMLDAMRQMIHDSETRLLQAFYGFAETTHKRFQQTDVTTTLLTSRVNTLEDRVFEIEKRLNVPPSA